MISTLLCLSGCQSLWYLFLDAVVDIAPDRFTSHALEKNNNETEYLIIMIHGGGLNAVNTFETGQKLIESLKICSEK